MENVLNKGCSLAKRRSSEEKTIVMNFILLES